MAKSPIPPTSSLQFRLPPQRRYDALIAVPCCNELESLPETLTSLELSAAQTERQALVVVNVNQRASMPKDNNLATLEWLSHWETSLSLAWLDHASEGLAYPEKFGVGLARHQACSVGLEFIGNAAPVISLDADSPVAIDYLPTIFEYVASHPGFQAGHVNFRHRHCGGEAQKQAILIYEQHLKRHRQKLADANSPHAWYAIGSTIVCTKSAYVKSGGYHCRRMAGEDFYLLQQLGKIGCEIEMLDQAMVFPSDRISDRVPFGTGKAVGDIVASGQWPTYHHNCYRDLAGVLTAVNDNLHQSAEAILQATPTTCQAWLKGRDFESVWPKLTANSRDQAMLRRKFHEWLDAFQTLKLIHYLSDHHYPRFDLATMATPN